MTKRPSSPSIPILVAAFYKPSAIAWCMGLYAFLWPFIIFGASNPLEAIKIYALPFIAASYENVTLEIFIKYLNATILTYVVVVICIQVTLLKENTRDRYFALILLIEAAFSFVHFSFPAHVWVLPIIIIYIRIISFRSIEKFNGL